ncbi:MAG: FtsX-like permease family protein, partial [Candidatus Omnitrophica bacterium]|nr:FtsX-like permease family protein [Candidatus Omnitrophota bacterium]
MGFELYIALKHLRARRQTGFISLITVISVLGVAVGVMALIVVLAVMSGFDRELKSKIVNVQPHLRIEKIGGVESPEIEISKIQDRGIEGLKTISAYVEGQGILRSDVEATGVLVKGLDTLREDLSIYERHMIHGDLDLRAATVSSVRRKRLFFKERVEKKLGGIVLGETLAGLLQVRVGDQVDLISPFKSGAKNGLSMRAESRAFAVRGIFRVGMNDFDSALVLISLPEAQTVYRLGSRASGLSLRFEDVDDAQKWKYFLQSYFSPEYYLRSWYDMNHNFFQALKVEKSVMTILLALIVLVAAFNIVSTLIMIVMEKTKDIGILRALGATRSSIRSIFMIEGFSVGMIGVVLGAASGLYLAFNLNQVSDFLKETTGLEVFPSDIYFFDKIPAQVHGPDVALI